MSSASILSKLSVPGSDPQGGGTHVYMPKMNYRYRAIFHFHPDSGIGANEEPLITNSVVSTDRPNISFEEVEMPVYNSRIYLLGRHQWEPVEMEFRDTIDSSTISLLTRQLEHQFHVIEQSGGLSGQGYKMKVEVETLDGRHDDVNVLDRWTMLGAMITKINPSRVEYGTSAYQTISVGFRYDMATLDGGFAGTRSRSGANLSAFGGAGPAVGGSVGPAAGDSILA